MSLAGKVYKRGDMHMRVVTENFKLSCGEDPDAISITRRAIVI